MIVGTRGPEGVDQGTALGNFEEPPLVVSTPSHHLLSGPGPWGECGQTRQACPLQPQPATEREGARDPKDVPQAG